MSRQQADFQPSRHPLRRSRPFEAEPESFVSRIRRVEKCVEDARKECERHHYSEAASLLDPLKEDVPGPLAGPFFEVLGRCATHGCGEDWMGSFHRAQTSFEETGDVLGSARVLLHCGEAEAARGDFLAATTALTRASRVFTREYETLGAADTALALARIALFQNRLESADERSTWAIEQYQAQKNKTREVLARLLRAQIRSTLGNSPQAARDLLFSERLAEHADTGTEIRISLARAESLLWLGYPHRALSILKPLKARVEERDEVSSTAHYLRLYGQSEREFKPKFAHFRLTEAAALFGRLGQRYYHAECELGLGIALQCQGQSARAHWSNLDRLNLSRWPILDHLFANARRQGVQAPSAFSQVGKAKLPDSKPPVEDRPSGHSPTGVAIFKRLGSLLEAFVSFLAGAADTMPRPEAAALPRHVSPSATRSLPARPSIALTDSHKKELIRERQVEQTAH